MKTPLSLRVILSVFVLINLLSACSAKESSHTVESTAHAPVSEDMVAKAATKNKATTDPLPQDHVIRQANVKFQVKDLETSTQRIEGMVEKLGAMLTSSTQTQNDYAQETDFVIRVKPAQFLPLLRQLQKESVQLDERSVSTEDVGLEYVDLQARLQAKRAVEQRYMGLLREAKNMEEIMKVEEQIQAIREDIERTDARLRYLQNQTAYSTIHLHIYQPLPISVPTAPSFFYRVLDAMNTGWQLMLSLIVGLFYVWPILIIGAGAYFLMRRRKLV
ncbi:DUF4349 domain-containing protein [Rufibacter roseus]|uniref:DUF4349 domain-containing protein n=1 Tax=Rufibacter roseus TaxID=1567108 RepID=A0ABW2DSM2_9BACT|nr:DUF4349 domain-containing protein [Rufibacter roseus]